MHRSLLTTVCGGIVCFSAAAAPQKGSWPQWRGFGGSGISTETNVLLEWNAEKGICWRTPLPGHGHSSPVVVDGRIFLTADVEGDVVPGAKAVPHILNGESFKHPDALGADRKHELHVMCVDAVNGKLLWDKTAFAGSMFDDHHRKANYAAPTIAADGGRIFASFGGEGLFCYDLTGMLIWSNRFGGLAQLGMGAGASPVLAGKAVVLQCDQDEGTNSFIAAFDKKNGKEVWRTARKVSVSWSSPVVATVKGREQVIASGSESIISYDATTGKEVWRHDGLENNAVPSPVVGNDTVYLCAGYPKKQTYAIHLGGAGDVTGSTNLLWKYDRGSGYVPSPILVGQDFYLVTDGGALTCLDARTGELRYDSARLPSPARFSTSPVAVAGHLLLTSEEGDTYVIKAGSKHEVVRKNPVGEKVLASLALADGRIYIRGETNLICIGRP